MNFTLQRRELSLAVALLVFAAVLGVAAPGFFTAANLRDLAVANTPVLIAAIGMTLVILSGQIDISTGSQFAICGVLAAVAAKAVPAAPVLAAAAAASLGGAVLGALNGALVSYAGIPSIVVTLATMVALRDALRWATGGAWIQELPAGFQWFGGSQAASEAITVTVAALLTVAVGWGLRNLAAGRSVYATGSNPAGARLTGIQPDRVVFSVFVVAGVLAGCAALLNSVRFNQVPSNAGIGMEMRVIASVVVGGTAVTGGRGSVSGTLLGVVLLGMVGPALTFLGVNAYWERAIQGAIILAAVAIDSVRHRKGRHAGSPAVQRA